MRISYDVLALVVYFIQGVTVMNNLVRTLACATAVVATTVACAQFGDEEDFEDVADPQEELSADEEDGSSADDESSDESSEDGAKAKGKSVKVSLDKPFHLMPLCRMLEGDGEVLRPGATEWKPLEEGRFYPLGCSYRTIGRDSRLIIQFGEGSEVSVSGASSFATFPQKIGDKKRAIALDSGLITVKLPRGLGQGMFSVTAPGFVVENLDGESRYSYRKTGDGDEAVVRCVTGAMSIKGRHFDIAKMTVANEIKIRTSQDNLFTGLYGNSGDVVVRLDQGLVAVQDFETKEFHDEPRYLDWHISPKTVVRIHRAMPEIGERMSVTVMTFDTKGELQNRCSFAEGRSGINTGEEGAGVLAKREQDAAKKAAEAAESISIEEGDEEEEGEESGDESESGDDEDSSVSDDEEDLF